jgi:tetratricopeptide (TPR) repeat protein
MIAAALTILLLAPQLVDRTQRQAELPAVAENLTYEKRADIFMARKMYREAVEAYRLALGEQPNSPQLHNKLGIAYHHQMLFDDARKSYERAVKLDKTFAQARNNLGTIFYAAKRYKKAAGTYKKALEYAPQSASIHSNLGMAHFARRKYKDASKEFMVALQLDPNVFETRSSVGTLLQERSIEDRAKYHYYLAKTYAAVGMHDRALLYLRKALEEGFKDRKRIPNEPEFEVFLDNAEFQRLVFPEQTAAELRPVR